jgi:hypothetical protein
MNVPCTGDRVLRSPRVALLASVLGLACSVAVAAAPTKTGLPEEQRAPAGRCLSPAGSLLERQASDKPWLLPRPQDQVFSHDLLLALPGQHAEVESANGAVHLVLWGNLPELSRSAVLESAVVLHNTSGFDLDITLERGRIQLVSTRDKEPAHIRVSVPGVTWEITLAEKGDEAALEYYGRWPHGVPFSAKPKPEDKPTEDLRFLALKGTAELKAGPRQFTLHAPAIFRWDSVDGNDSSPHHLDKKPDWTDPEPDQRAAAGVVKDVLDRLHEGLRDKPLGDVLDDLRASADRDADAIRAGVTRRFVVYAVGATDDLPRLLQCLTDAKHADVREAGIEALRHWIGRGPGQDQQVYNLLLKQEKLTPTQAEVVMQLLHSPFQSDEPETYQTLIDYLRHDKLAVRELARWHLYRLAPAGKEIAYDAAGPAEEREKAYTKWKELIPEGKLPPKPRSGQD